MFSLSPSMSKVAASLCLGLRRARVTAFFTSLRRAVGLLGCVLRALRGVHWLIFLWFGGGLSGFVDVHVLVLLRSVSRSSVLEQLGDLALDSPRAGGRVGTLSLGVGKLSFQSCCLGHREVASEFMFVSSVFGIHGLAPRLPLPVFCLKRGEFCC